MPENADPVTPVSWLTLELYALGELSAEQAEEVRAHLETDPQSRACLARIQADERYLPALPTASAGPGSRPERALARLCSLWAWPMVAAVASDDPGDKAATRMAPASRAMNA